MQARHTPSLDSVAGLPTTTRSLQQQGVGGLLCADAVCPINTCQTLMRSTRLNTAVLSLCTLFNATSMCSTTKRLGASHVQRVRGQSPFNCTQRHTQSGTPPGRAPPARAGDGNVEAARVGDEPERAPLIPADRTEHNDIRLAALVPVH